MPTDRNQVGQEILVDFSPSSFDLGLGRPAPEGAFQVVSHAVETRPLACIYGCNVKHF